ncbi:DNA-binding response regulator, NarL/FixJ family [Terrimicrobium sacchariphilum]|uniref:DNA-binding response regulator, NarL/FixJ family n=1 Tax=Terrimicrobium sacchariphilum TaxID=690879 RepID=A0A146GCU9_TERSA|nr:response regulator transcription factor [Terrimicrobium sacchariphilum]GAT34368.1 DNA-binding response regulator, NarL/FixJ family [Terrimicrobium sacchariphilum]
MKSLSLLLVEDQVMFLDLLQSMLKTIRAIDRVGTACTLGDARDLCVTHDYDLIISDYMLPDGSAHDLIRDVHRLKPDQDFIILSALPVPEGISENGSPRVYWIDKNNTFHSLKDRIDSLFGSRVKGDDLPVSRLTGREREVLQLIGGGFTSKEIAGRLALSVQTIETHRKSIAKKLGMSGAELVSYGTIFFRS